MCPCGMFECFIFRRKIYWRNHTAAAKAGLRVFPNPASHECFLEINSHERICNVQVLVRNVFGEIVYLDSFDESGSAFKDLLHLDELAAGDYIVEVKMQGERYVRNLLKQE
jgi:hypothetical protein